MNRILNDLVLRISEESVRRGLNPAIIYEAPTGYGKTASSLSFYAVLSKYEMTSGLIHVLPMRSITTELYCKLINALGHHIEYCKDFSNDVALLTALTSLRITYKDVGYQFMDYIDPSKSPFFLKEILITTFNSFFHNLARFPVGELRKYRKHYEVPRMSIFTASIVLDEAHLYGGDPGSGSEEDLITSFIVSVKALARARVPLLIESATLPHQIRDELKYIMTTEGVSPKLVLFNYGTSKCSDDLGLGDIECYDEEYVNSCLNVRWVTKVIDDDVSGIVDLAINHMSQGHKVLIVRNTVEKAVKTFLKLKEHASNVTLIHGRFTEADRALKLRECRSSRIVVSTQVIEAGVNMNFDVLITDAASPSSIVQRAGRVARGCNSSEAYVYIVKSDGDGVYDPRLTKSFLHRVINVLSQGHQIEWRIPSNKVFSTWISFLRILEEVYKDADAKLAVDSSRYVNFLDIVTRPIISTNDLISVYRKFCGLLYSSTLLPLYVDNELPQTIDEVFKNSVPLSVRFIMRNSSTILLTTNDMIQVIALECNDEISECRITKERIKKEVLSNPINLLMMRWDSRLIPLAFISKPGIYQRDIGLTVY